MKLNKRTKILLSVLQEMGGNLSDFRMQRLLCLYCTEFVKNGDYYEFIHLGKSPYSLQAGEDKKSLIKNKLLERSDDWILTQTEKRFAVELDFFEKMALQDLRNKFFQASDEDLEKSIIYDENPSFLEADEIIFYTIGYEGLSPEAYINLLLQNKVRLLVDVRKNAYSQKYGFSKTELRENLGLVGIEYIHLPELGIISEKRKELNYEQDYADLFVEYEQTTLKNSQNELAKLQSLLEKKRCIAITCFEADHNHCHRSRVANALKARGGFNYKIEHLQPCKHSKNHKLNEKKFL